MTLDDLTATLDMVGVRLSLRLVVDAPRGVLTPEILTPEIKAALQAHKPALLALLSSVDDLAKPESRGATDAGRPVGPTYPWRTQLPGWPIPWREAWGLRADELQDQGLSWWRAERQAFAEVSRLEHSGGLSSDAEVAPILGALGMAVPADACRGGADHRKPSEDPQSSEQQEVFAWDDLAPPALGTGRRRSDPRNHQRPARPRQDTGGPASRRR
jgi:hypothetical protein